MANIFDQFDEESVFDRFDNADSQKYDQLASETNPLQAGMISAGKGFYNVGRGLGLVDKPDEIEREAMAALERQHPKSTMVGEAVGEAAPFLPLGVGAGALRSTAGRILGGAATGALEGGVISHGREANPITGAILGGSLAGLSEVFLPGFIRTGRKLFRKMTGRAPKGAVVSPTGEPTPEFAQFLQENDLSLDDIAKQELSRMQESGQLSPRMAQRIARFRSEGVSPTLGDVTQDFNQQAIEARLFESSADDLADPMRARRLEQSNALRSNLDEMAGDTGDEVGSTVKGALESRKSALKRAKNKFYKIAEDRANEAGDVPIFTDELSAALPDRQTLRRIERLEGSQAKALNDLLVEFGIDTSDEAVEAFKHEITPLSVKNFEDFRAAINQIERADKTGAIKIATGPLKEALDQQLDDVAKMGNMPEDVLKALKKARETVRTVKTEFSPQSIAGRLVDVKRDGVTPVIEASKVYKTLVGGQVDGKIEPLQRVLASLAKSKKGVRAIGDIQSATILDLIESSFKTQSRKVQGQAIFNPIQFVKRLEQIGDDRLNAIFKSNPAVLRRLKNISQIAKDLTPPSGAQPKGSANIILDSLKKLGVLGIMGKIPGGGVIAQGVSELSKRRARGQDVSRALTPQLQRTITLLESEFPKLASALGIPVAISATEDME